MNKYCKMITSPFNKERYPFSFAVGFVNKTRAGTIGTAGKCGGKLVVYKAKQITGLFDGWVQVSP